MIYVEVEVKGLERTNRGDCHSCGTIFRACAPNAVCPRCSESQNWSWTPHHLLSEHERRRLRAEFP